MRRFSREGGRKTYHRRVDVDEDSRLITRVHARNLDRWPGDGASATRHLHLAARNVELRAALALGHVQADLLRSNEVFSVRCGTSASSIRITNVADGKERGRGK